MTKAVLYARTAASDAAQIARQLDACREAARRSGWTVASEHADDGSSGSSAARDGLTAAIAALAPEAVLVVQDLARLARDPSDLVAIANEIEARGASLHCLAGGDIRTIRLFNAPETDAARLARRRDLAQRARISS